MQEALRHSQLQLCLVRRCLGYAFVQSEAIARRELIDLAFPWFLHPAEASSLIS